MPPSEGGSETVWETQILLFNSFAHLNLEIKKGADLRVAITTALDSTEIGKLGEIAYIGLNAWAEHVDQHLEKRPDEGMETCFHCSSAAVGQSLPACPYLQQEDHPVFLPTRAAIAQGLGELRRPSWLIHHIQWPPRGRDAWAHCSQTSHRWPALPLWLTF